MGWRRSAVLVLAAACSFHERDGGAPAGGADAAPAVDAAPACQVAAATAPLEVATDRGLVRGAARGGVTRFLGVPFAEPPVGARRFTAPTPAACWADVREAVAYAPECVQRNVLTGAIEGDEDCLYLNVWTPTAALTDGRPRPVLFWIYGGGNVIGSTDVPNPTGGEMYDGQPLAEERDVVVVSVAYRVGGLGFLAHPALEASGSYGTLDQIAGLRWVQENVAAFGGDPAHVMVFGESAGGIDTCTLIASPLARGLFASAVVQSGYCAAIPHAERVALDAPRVEAAGCAEAADVAACLRAAEVDALTPAFGELASAELLPALRTIPAATIDGTVLVEHPLAAIEAGRHNGVPTIVGTNADESALFLAAEVVLTCGAYEDHVRALVPGAADRVLAAYPCAPLDPKRALVALETDATFTCPTRRLARALDGAGTPVHRYYFTYDGVSPLGAYHTAEIPYVFGTYATPLSLPVEHTLSDLLQGYWTRLAATGDPNGDGAPTWAEGGDDVLELASAPGTLNDLLAARCDLWDELTPR